MRALLSSSLVATVVLLAGCASDVCDKNASLDLSKKVGDCGLPVAPVFGEKAACRSRLSTCSEADQQLMTRALDCVAQLTTCSSGEKDHWLQSQQLCFAPLAALSKACADGFFGGVLPGQDAGADGGAVDAGPQAITDGGEGLALIAVADETTTALAWTQRQPGLAATWVLMASDEGSHRDPDRELPPATRSSYSFSDGGAYRTYWLAGFTRAGTLAFGEPDGGLTGLDAGFTQCLGHLDCPPEQVCDLNQCKVQTCQAAMYTCPTGYDCLGQACYRLFSDAGVFDAGASQDAGPVTEPLPFVSNPQTVQVGPPQFSTGVYLGGFPGKRADLIAIDSARVVVVLEQEGQLIAHASSLRGRDFGVDQGTTSNIDTVGTRAKGAYNPESQTVYVCYNVGRGVRVRRSSDFGRSWTGATDVAPAQDGGFASKYNDCDIAPWKDGGAIMVTVDDDGLAVRTVSPGLAVSDPVSAFLSSGPDAGNIYAPAHPAIATLPSEGIVHVTFTATRQLPTLVTDTEPFGVYRDAALGSFTEPRFLNPGVLMPGTAYPQDYSTVAVDPVTKKAIAAYTSLESGPGGDPIATVHTSLWNPATRAWGTGSDLNVFAVDPRDNNSTLLFEGKVKNDLWDAFSPIYTVSPAGKLFLSVVAGPRSGFAGDYRLYLCGFDFDAQSPGSTAKGWYVGRMRKVSEARVLNPGAVASTPPPTVSAFAADSQISVYATHVEGLGPSGDTEGKLRFVTLPK